MEEVSTTVPHLPLVELQQKEHRHRFHDGDTQLLEILAQYVFARPLHVSQRAKRHIVSVRRRLRQLYERGYLQRYRLPVLREPGEHQAGPADQAVYALTPQGGRVAQTLGIVDAEYHAPTAKSVLMLPHEMKLANFHLALDLATENNPSCQLIHWEQRRSRLQKVFEHQGRRRIIAPDALLALRYKNREPDRNVRYFFVEMEAGRPHSFEEGESNLLQKIRNYRAYQELNLSPTHDGQTFRFRVIFVLPTLQRCLNFCSKVQEAHLATKAVWITASSVYSLQQPERVLEKIFVTPRDFAQQALYSLAD